MLLATSDEVLARMSLGNRSGADANAITSALQAATAYLSRAIGTSLDRQERTDWFGSLRNQATRLYPLYTLNLTSSYLDEDEVPKVYLSSDGEPISGFGASGNATLIDALYSEVYYDKGRVDFRYTDFDPRKYRILAVRYVSGFAVETAEDGESYYSNVPNALREAAIQCALVFLRNSGAPMAKVDEATARRGLNQASAAIVAPLIRTMMVGDWPQHSVTS